MKTEIAGDEWGDDMHRDALQSCNDGRSPDKVRDNEALCALIQKQKLCW